MTPSIAPAGAQQSENDAAAHRAASYVRPSRRRRPGLDDQRRDSINAHFAPGSPHACGECGPVCTFGDW
ncbi:hypothetical protein OG244_28355 [Streptomyces brevispora]|uniref:hypothetical protein n=1 Tax=Streptomyces brevispora TaxID=887462 RepID=UPI002E36BDBD|nr:hypothetical protein [Streptomyces brevispora]